MFNVCTNQENLASSVNRRPSVKPKGIVEKPSKVARAQVAPQMSWSDIQAKNFTQWINFAFEQNGSEVNAKAQGVAIKDEIQSKLSNLVCAIDSNELNVRDERDIHVDVGLHDVLCEILLSYNMNWLKLACSIVLDFQPAQAMKPFQKQLLQSLLWTDKKKVNSNGLQKHFLKKLFEIVLFLDTAKNNNVFSSALFVKTCNLKSSKDVIAAICKEFLKGEGDIFRHLASLEYNPDYQQSDIDEYDLKVTNILTDLRDGVRLCRLVDVISNATTPVCKKLLVPALNISRKEHNVKQLLRYIFQTDKQSYIKPNDIVSGNKDKTFLLLWEIFFQIKLKDLLDCRNIEAEIAKINGETIVSEKGPVRLAPSSNLSNNNHVSAKGNTIAKSLTDLLIKWVGSIVNVKHSNDEELCKRFNGHNCSSSALFEDGVALCTVINYYHPNIMHFEDILTTHSVADHISLDVTHNAVAAGSEHGRKQHNWLAFAQACRVITGIPSISSDSISSKHLSDNQPLLIFLSYFFSRLAASTTETNLLELEHSVYVDPADIAVIPMEMDVVDTESANETLPVATTTNSKKRKSRVLKDIDTKNTMSASAFIQEQRKKRKSSMSTRNSMGGSDSFMVLEDVEGMNVLLSKKQMEQQKSKETMAAVAEAEKMAAMLKAKQEKKAELDRLKQEQEAEAARVAEEAALQAQLEEEEALRLYQEEEDKKIAEEAERLLEIKIRNEKAEQELRLKEVAEAQRIAKKEAAELRRKSLAAEKEAARMALVEERKSLEMAESARIELEQFRAEEKKKVNSATIIQAMTRGASVRTQRKRKLSIIAAKLMKANEVAKSHPELIIGTKTSNAICTLKLHAANHDQSLAPNTVAGTHITTGELLRAVKNLEYSTEVSKVCCKKMIKGESAGLLMHLIRTCDRSRDSQELLQTALVTLLNIARYDELAYFVSCGDNSSIATIIDLLQMFRDKKGVFSVACELMCRIVSADENAKVRHI